MFFKIACLYLAVTCVFAAPPIDVVPLEKQQPTVIPIVSQSEELEANGTYKYSYETANGIKREETSYDKVLPKAKSGSSSNEAGEEGDESNEIHVQQGSYSYTAPDGTLISVRYIADENGFRPIGDHLPKPPSVAAQASSGRRAKTLDAAESGSAPAPAAAAVPETPKGPQVSDASLAPEIPKSNEAPKSSETPTTSQDTKAPTATESASTPKSPALETRLGENSAEQVSTTEASNSSVNPESSATEAPSTTEIASSTTEQVTSTEVSTTAAPEKLTTTEEASTSASSTESSTSEPSSDSSTPQEPLSTSGTESPTPQESASTSFEEPSTPAVSLAAKADAVTTPSA